MANYAAQVTTQVSGALSGTGSQQVSDSSIVGGSESPLVAQPAVLTLRSGNTTGTLTMTNNSHGVITGQRLDFYWSNGHCYGVNAGTVSVNSVPIASVTGGDNLPPANTAITVGIPMSTAFAVTGNSITILSASIPTFAATPPAAGYFVFSNGVADEPLYLPSGGIYTYANGTPIVGTNILASQAPTVVWMSHNNTTAPVRMTAAALAH